jgi:hypothetical protein
MSTRCSSHLSLGRKPDEMAQKYVNSYGSR